MDPALKQYTIAFVVLFVINICGSMVAEVATFAILIMYQDKAYPIAIVMMGAFHFPQLLFNAVGLWDEVSLAFFPRLLNATAWSMTLLLGYRVLSAILRALRSRRREPNNSETL